MIAYIIKINGIYDILCALSILKFINIPILNNLHLSMISTNKTPLMERFFAYWIFTYGVIRMYNNLDLIAYSYYIEAAFIFNECTKNTIYLENGLFISFVCVFMGNLSLLSC
jgi:hypothetical protein